MMTTTKLILWLRCFLLGGLVLSSGLLVACFSPKINEGVTCGVGDSCPSGMQCDPADNRCRFDLLDANGANIDAAPGVADASIDANIPPPENAQLSSLVPSEGALIPSFASTVTNYDNLIGLIPTALTLTATTSAGTAALTIDGTDAISGTASSALNLNYGANIHLIEVTDGDQTGTYSVRTSRGAGIAEDTYIKANTSDQDDTYGRAIDIDGNTMVVYAQNKGAANNGYVYVYDYTPGTGWAFTQELVGSNTEANDGFGISVAIQGDVIVVGATGESSNSDTVQSNNSTSAVGAAYVFRHSAGSWSQVAYLKPQAKVISHLFGTSVDVYNGTIVVSAMDQIVGTETVYVFNSSDNINWTRVQAITSPQSSDRDNFGTDIALDLDTLVVGARTEDGNGTGVDPAVNNSGNNTGAAFVYRRSGGSFNLEAYLKASNTDNADNFGDHVAISGNTLVVTAGGEASNAVGIGGSQLNNSLQFAGAAYVFTRSGTTWTQQAYIKASNAGSPDRFGKSVALDGDVLVVGATGESGTDCSGSNQADNAGLDTGAAYLYGRNGTTWEQLKYLKASNCEIDDGFGSAVGTSNGVVVVGADREDGGGNGVGAAPNNNQIQAGAVYTFR